MASTYARVNTIYVEPVYLTGSTSYTKLRGYVSAGDRIMGPVHLTSGDLDPHTEVAIDDIRCCQAGHRVRLCRGMGLDPRVPGTYERTRTGDAGHSHPLGQRKKSDPIFEPKESSRRCSTQRTFRKISREQISEAHTQSRLVEQRERTLKNESNVAREQSVNKGRDVIGRRKEPKVWRAGVRTAGDAM